jgi:hypothetical protein
MGQLNSNIPFTGTVNGLSAYKVRGSDKIILRKKGGPTKKQIQKKESFATTRKNNMEFGGRASITGQVMDVLRPLKYLGDYNIAGPLNTLFIPIQQLDTEHEKGQRSIELTKDPGVLEGFNLNRRTPFESIILTPLEYTLSKETLTGTITLPELVPEKNFMVPGNFSWYKLIMVSGTIENMYYDPGFDDTYLPIGNRHFNAHRSQETDWLPVYPGSPALTINSHMKITRTDFLRVYGFNKHSLLLGIGIAFGTMQRGQITMAKYIGGAKILAMA